MKIEHGYRKVYVSDISIEDALIKKRERILITTLPKHTAQPHICVDEKYKEAFLKWGSYLYSSWYYIVEIPEEKTISISTTDWQQVDISIEKARELWFNIN